MYDARDKMLKEIMALDFMAIELNLYLNTHPYDQKALMIFVNTAQRAKMLRDNYESMYGPLTAAASNSFPWPWIESPWPWEADGSKSDTV
jgi:spore coat protein JB